jgi:hypothetical protein
VSELRVPTIALDAEILCADGRSFNGRIFLPAAAHHHTGPMRPAEWMNDAAPFFPFLPSDATTSVILNKHEVLILTVGAMPAPEDEASVAALREHRVTVECRDRVVSGTVTIDMPETQLRVVDYLNRPDPFLIVREGDRDHLIRKARITRVLESWEG